ncbi:MAG: LemA family protein [Myxococcota bacterium]
MLVALIVLVVVALLVVSLYNRLVGLRNRGENAWSDIDVQLKRRHELIPNLVETVKGYASHEQKTLQGVTDARTRAMQGGAAADRARAEGELSRSIGALFAVAEAYPQLKANENFVALQGQLAQLEEAIQSARRYYNAIVRDLNTATETFPSNLIASAFSFSRREYFELDSPAERSVPKVSFGA